MDLSVLKIMGQVEAIGGITLGAFLIAFRETIQKRNFSKLPSRQAYRLVWLSIGIAWSIGLLGMSTWIYSFNAAPRDFPPASAGSPITSSGGQSPTIEGTSGDVSINFGRPPTDPCVVACQTRPTSPLDAALDKLIAGNIAFNNPERMRVGQPHIVEVKLSTTLPPAELKTHLTQAGESESASLQVGDRMSATLNGGAAFDISPSGPQTQWISQNQVTTWTWNVTPKTAGTQYLIMAFDAVITVDGKDGTRNVRTLTHKIDVEVGWPETAGEWFELGRKWFENVGWVWASILVPAGVAIAGLWHRIRHRKRMSRSVRVRGAGR